MQPEKTKFSIVSPVDHTTSTTIIKDSRKVSSVNACETNIETTQFDITDININELDRSFMYTQLLIEVILDIKYDAKTAREEFIQYYRRHCTAENFQSKVINQFQQYYEDHSAIWWYTKEWFLYSSLNKALRTQDIETIIKIGFFIHDLCKEIKQRHSEIYYISKMIVYRGQGLSNVDFEKLRKSEGELFSFNNFLSTSSDRDVSLAFAESVRSNDDMLGILFVIEIDPSISSISFAQLDNSSHFDLEAETLFSMHTIFRIGNMKEIENRLWEVNLASTDNNDQQLKRLTGYIRDEIRSSNGWLCLALLMMRMSHYDKALEILNKLPEVLSDNDPETSDLVQTLMSGQIGHAEQILGNYSIALLKFEKILKYLQIYMPDNHTDIATLYSNIGMTYQSMGDFSCALSSFEKALEILQQSSSFDSISLAIIYSNIGNLCQTMGDYTLALSHSEKALEMLQKSLPSNHPQLAVVHNNLGEIYKLLGNYSMTLTLLEKALEIQRKSLPPNHSDLATTYNNLGEVCRLMDDYSNALSYYNMANEIWRKTLPSNHPNFSLICRNVGAVQHTLGNYSIASSFYQNALEIQQKSLTHRHPSLAGAYNCLGEVYQLMGDYSNAQRYYEITMEILQKKIPPNHPHFAIIYNNIGLVHQSLGNYLTALSYHQNALEIQQKSLPPHHPDLIKTQSNIGLLCYLTQDNMSLIMNMEKAYEGQQKLLQLTYPSLGTESSQLNVLNELMKQCSKLFPDSRRIVELEQKLVLSDGSTLKTTDENIDEVLIEEFMEKSTTLLLNLEKVCELQRKCSPIELLILTGTQLNVNDNNQMLDNLLTYISHFKKEFEIPSESRSYNDEETTNSCDDSYEQTVSMNEQSNALISYQKYLEGIHKYNPPNDVSLSTNFNNIGETYYSMKSYTDALSLFEKALEHLQKCQPINQQLLAKTYKNIAMALDGLDQHREAIANAEQALETACSALGPTHLETEIYRNYLDKLKQKL